MTDLFKFTIAYFHGQRRRDGLLMLVLATAFMCGWLRSRMIQDDFLVQCVGDVSYHLRSHDNAICGVYRVWTKRGPVREEELFSISYWCIVVPMTVVSAYLLLSKPPQAKPVKSAGPAPESVE